MPSLPTGTVTLLFSDIEGSTRLLDQLGDRYSEVLADYRQLIRTASQKGNGHVVDTQGDAIFIAFPRAKDAVAAAVAAQRSILSHQWPSGVLVRVRMGLHTGEPVTANTGYVGMDVHRAARICAAGHGGQILLSDTTQALVVMELPEGVSLRDLGEHRLKDLAHPHRLFQVTIADLPIDFPPLMSLDSLPHNLPLQLTSFVGRAREMVDVKRLLSSTRLLTLIGAGGAGKTRLALQIGGEVLDEYEHGVWLVDLAPLSDPGLVPQIVATTLNVRDQPGRPVQAALIDYLQPRQVLLILDNCEHLVFPCAQLTEALLRACQQLKVLATSREGLAIAGELTYRVPSLGIPDLGRLPSLEALAQLEGIRLFIERATLGQPTFGLSEQNARAVAQICTRLDGIPLAIELAAARMKSMSVNQVAARLDERFRLLTSGGRTELPRHQTLRAAMDWSYGLLPKQERIMLHRLSVFAGGWTLEAAEAVCAGEEIDTPDVLDLMMHLVEKSLVTPEPQGGETRYRLLETLRQYGYDRLMESGETTLIRGRHRDWLLALVEQAEAHLWGPEQSAWIRRLDSEHDNLRTALEFCKAEGGGNSLRLAGALWPFWEIRGHMSEGRRWLGEALSVTSPMVQPATRAKGLTAAGVLAYRQGDHAAARAFHEESLAISRTAGDSAGVALSLNSLGNVARDEGDFIAAASFYKESLAMRRALNDQRGVAYTLNNLGNVIRAQGNYVSAQALFEEALASLRLLGDRHAIATLLGNLGFTAWEQGDYAGARAYHEEALAIYRELTDRSGIGDTLSYLGLVAGTTGDHPTARAFFEESVAIRREVGNRRGLAYTLGNLALNAHERGDDVSAQALLEEALTIQREVGDKRGIAYSLERFAGLATANDRCEQAAQLFGAAEVIRQTIIAPLAPAERADYDRDVAAIRAALGEEKFSTAWAQGRAMTLEQAIEYALKENR